MICIAVSSLLYWRGSYFTSLPLPVLLVVASRADQYDGIVFVYDFVLNAFWERSATISSPLARVINTQGFGYRVGVSGDFIIVSTAVNNGNYHTHTPHCSSPIAFINILI